MGIPLFWNEVYEHAHKVNLKELHLFLTKDAKKKSRIRLGIDISVWMKHAIVGKEFLLLRTIFYRLCKLANLSNLIPIFVFDGIDRPALKRGKKTSFIRTTSGRNLFGNLEIQVKELIESFGFILLQAPGEAEAELADLNKRGLIDAILSDDSDCFLFGAKTVIRNWGEKLVGTTAFLRTRRAKEQANKNNRASSPASSKSSQSELLASSSDDNSEVKVGSSSQQSTFIDKSKQGDHVYVYRVDDFAKGVNAASCVLLIGLLGGGDYDTNGVRRCGIRTAIGLSKGGFDERLLKGVKKNLDPPLSHTSTPRVKSESNWQTFLQEWKEDIKVELQTNASGNLNRKEAKLANSEAIDNLFTTSESMTVLAAYIWPNVSGHKTIPDQRALDLQQVAKVVCSIFSWNKEYAQKTLRKNLFTGYILQWFHGLHENEMVVSRTPQDEYETPTSTPAATVASQSPSKSKSSPSKSKKKAVHGRDLRVMLSSSKDGLEQDNSDKILIKKPSQELVLEVLRERESEAYVEVRIDNLAEFVEAGIDEGIKARVDDDAFDRGSISEEDELESSAPSETNDMQNTTKKSSKPFDQKDPIRFWIPLEALLLRNEGKVQYEEYTKRKAVRDRIENERKLRQEKKKSFDESQQKLSSFFRSNKPGFISTPKLKPSVKPKTSKPESLLDTIDNAFSSTSPTASPTKRKALQTPHASSSSSIHPLSESEDEAERTILPTGNGTQALPTINTLPSSDDSVEFVRVDKTTSNNKNESIIILD